MSAILAVSTAILAGASTCEAGSVTYSTSGSFNGGGPSLTIGSSTLSFTGVSTTYTDPTNSTFAQVLPLGLGSFTLASTAVLADVFVGQTFTLSITQTFPNVTGGANPGTATASVNGSVTSVNPNSNTLVLGFTPATIDFTTAAGTISYRPDAATFVTVNSGPIRLGGSVQMPAGTPTVPLPTSALGGLGLIGATALGKLMRSSKASNLA